MDETPLADLFEKYEAEGLARGEDEARKKGYEGEEFGNFAKGFAEGYSRSCILTDVAKRLLAQGLSNGHVAEVTGLSPNLVEGLALLAR